MARNFECPKCKAEIGDSYQDDEPDVGIVGGYYCEVCDKGYSAEHESFDDDVMISGTGSGSSHLCACGTPKEMGYGLAGGGIGPYMYCPKCGIVTDKSQEPL